MRTIRCDRRARCPPRIRRRRDTRSRSPPRKCSAQGPGMVIFGTTLVSDCTRPTAILRLRTACSTACQRICISPCISAAETVAGSGIRKAATTRWRISCSTICTSAPTFSNRHAAGRRLLAVAFRSAREDDRARPRLDQDRRAGREGRAAAPHPGGEPLCTARAFALSPAIRICQH